METRKKHIVKAFDEQLDTLKTRVLQMGKKVENQLERALVAFKESDVELARDVVEKDRAVNEHQSDIDKLTVRLLATRQPMASDLRVVIGALKMAIELERIADYAANIARYVPELADESAENIFETIHQMISIALEMLSDVLCAYRDFDWELAVKVWHRDEKIDEHYNELLSGIIRNSDETCRISTSPNLLFVGRSCERIGDHITNLAEDVYYIANGETYHGQFGV